MVNAARVKIVVLGSMDKLSESILEPLRSLHIEHVSPASMMRPEICRRKLSGRKAEEAVFGALRHWYWTRKPDAGYLLKDFPATMLQALVFDEWLEARSDALDFVIAAEDADPQLIEHYRNFGLLLETSPISRHDSNQN